MGSHRQFRGGRPRPRLNRRLRTLLEPLEGRALLATLFVDGHAAGAPDGSAAHPYGTIQAAISASASNDTVVVAPGTYAETLTVAHPLTLLGPNAGKDPNTAARGAEAVIVPPTDNAAGGIGVLVTASNVTIDGLTLEGKNPALTGALNAASGVTNVDFSGNAHEVSGLAVRNDVIRDYALFGVIADANDFGTPAHVSTGNTVQNDKIDHIPGDGTKPGRGISIEDDFYADVTGNVVTRATTGIQAIVHTNPSGLAGASVIRGNTVYNDGTGIFVWNQDAGTPTFTVADNQVLPDPGAAPNLATVGVEVRDVLHTTGVTLTNNNVTGASVGVKLDYVTSSAPVTVSGGTLSGNAVGVLLTNADPPAGTTAFYPSQANLVGVKIVNSGVAGLEVTDAQPSPVYAPLTLNVDATTTVTGSPHGIVLNGPNARYTDAGIPTVTITSGPQQTTTATTATFAVAGADNVTAAGDLKYQYALDNAAPVAASVPITLTGLGVGPHSVTVSVTDQAGNSNATTYHWTVVAPTPTPTPTPLGVSLSAFPLPAGIFETSNASIAAYGKVSGPVHGTLSGTYTVTDANGVVVATGAVVVRPDLSYWLLAAIHTPAGKKGDGDDQHGRGHAKGVTGYTVSVTFKDTAGDTGTTSALVALPVALAHDPGDGKHHSGGDD